MARPKAKVQLPPLDTGPLPLYGIRCAALRAVLCCTWLCCAVLGRQAGGAVVADVIANATTTGEGCPNGRYRAAGPRV